MIAWWLMTKIYEFIWANGNLKDTHVEMITLVSHKIWSQQKIQESGGFTIIYRGFLWFPGIFAVNQQVEYHMIHMGLTSPKPPNLAG